jgi:glycosyltransferase involved in cell wall biosynthesis
MEFAKDCNGVIVRNDVRALANSAVDLAISPQKIKEMSKESGKQVSWFSPQKIGAELVNVYENGIQQG